MISKLRALVERVTSPHPEFDRWRDEQVAQVAYWRDFKDNQFRAGIADLNDQLRIARDLVEATIAGDWHPIDRAYPMLADLVEYIGEYEIEERAQRGCIERTAKIDVHGDDRKLGDLLYAEGDSKHRRTVINWKGNLWWLKGVEVSRQHEGFGGRSYMIGVEVEIELMCIPHPAQTKQQFLYGSEKAPVSRRAAIGRDIYQQIDSRPIERLGDRDRYAYL